jgi:hypothetical protein
MPEGLPLPLLARPGVEVLVVWLVIVVWTPSLLVVVIIWVMVSTTSDVLEVDGLVGFVVVPGGLDVAEEDDELDDDWDEDDDLDEEELDEDEVDGVGVGVGVGVGDVGLVVETPVGSLPVCRLTKVASVTEKAERPRTRKSRSFAERIVAGCRRDGIGVGFRWGEPQSRPMVGVSAAALVNDHLLPLENG